MDELYEIMKTVDVLFFFFIIYGFLLDVVACCVKKMFGFVTKHAKRLVKKLGEKEKQENVAE